MTTVYRRIVGGGTALLLLVSCILIFFTAEAYAVSGTVRRTAEENVSWGNESEQQYFSNTHDSGDNHYASFEATLSGKKYTTFCRQHAPISSPDFGGVSCEASSISNNETIAKVAWYWGIQNGWNDFNAGRLRLSRTFSYINGYSCEPYKESVVKGWIREAEAKTIPASADFVAYEVVPAQGLQLLLAYDGKAVHTGYVKVKKVSAESSITG